MLATCLLLAVATVDPAQHATHAAALRADPDCTAHTFSDAKSALKAFNKCRMVVLKNFLPMPTVQAARADFQRYINGLGSGHVGRTGTTSDGRRSFMRFFDPATRDQLEVLLPLESAATLELLLTPLVQSVLSAGAVLGPSLAVGSLGAVITTPGAAASAWSSRGGYPLGGGSELVGHDLPPYSVTLVIPLANLTARHGPTEFLVGSSALAGTADAAGTPRVPLLQMGDAVLVDHSVSHREGPNLSEQARAVLYISVRRPWFSADDEAAATPVPATALAGGADGVAAWFTAKEAEGLAEAAEGAAAVRAELAPLLRPEALERAAFLLRCARYAIPDEGSARMLDDETGELELEALEFPEGWIPPVGWLEWLGALLGGIEAGLASTLLTAVLVALTYFDANRRERRMLRVIAAREAAKQPIAKQANKSKKAR